MYMQVVRGKNKGYGLPADIWSLGCTVLEMLTGQIPYSNLEPVCVILFLLPLGGLYNPRLCFPFLSQGRASSIFKVSVWILIPLTVFFGSRVCLYISFCFCILLTIIKQFRLPILIQIPNFPAIYL